jgi:hypothetical protein
VTDPDAVHALLGLLSDRHKSSHEMAGRLIRGDPSENAVHAEILMNQIALIRGEQIIVGLLNDLGLAIRSVAKRGP